MNPYDEVYVSNIMRNQGRVFFDVREALPGVDEQWFVIHYMKSKVRSLLDHANPKFAAMPSPELIDYFIRKEQNNMYKKGEEWGGFLPQWVGIIYSLYQWQYNIPSNELVTLLPPVTMEKIYPTLHQLSFEAAVKKIHDELLCLTFGNY